MNAKQQVRRSPFHEGERQVQARLGVRVDGFDNLMRWHETMAANRIQPRAA
ncbi:MAG: hypothetical protein RIM84_18730 [Alphaproteobacteria bacterium]